MSAYARPMRPVSGSRFEAYAWFFMRISGFVVLFLALIHFFWMHFTIGVENITFDTIVGRWTAAGFEGAFWRTYDLFLLVFGFTHGMNGARQVIEDHVTDKRGRQVIWYLLVAVWALLIFMGAWIIFTFRPGMPTPFNLPDPIKNIL
jgi:succinate dehydrogenase / fumarate reductase membrane anchor subunit